MIGPYGSEESRAVTDFAGLFHIPVVSPTATSSLLSDTERFKYFLRTVPSDAYQVKAISHLLGHFKWNFIVLVVSDDEYGRSARLAFKEEQRSSANPFCTEVEEVITQNNIETVYEKVAQAKRARVIVLFANSDEAKDFISHASKKNLRGFTWIAPDGWNRNTAVTTCNEDFLKGMIGISPYEVETPGFRAHIEAANSHEPSHDQLGKCGECFKNMTPNISCTESLLSIAPYETSSTVNAVLAVANAVHKILGCNDTWCSKKIQQVDWSDLITYLRDIRFVNASNKTITLNESKITNIEYKIWNLHKTNGKFEYVEIGRWHANDRINGTIDIYNEANVQWYTGSLNVPNSSCSISCRKGRVYEGFY